MLRLNSGPYNLDLNQTRETEKKGPNSQTDFNKVNPDGAVQVGYNKFFLTNLDVNGIGECRVKEIAKGIFGVVSRQEDKLIALFDTESLMKAEIKAGFKSKELGAKPEKKLKVNLIEESFWFDKQLGDNKTAFLLSANGKEKIRETKEFLKQPFSEIEAFYSKFGLDLKNYDFADFITLRDIFVTFKKRRKIKNEKQAYEVFGKKKALQIKSFLADDPKRLKLLGLGTVFEEIDYRDILALNERFNEKEMTKIAFEVDQMMKTVNHHHLLRFEEVDALKIQELIRNKSGFFRKFFSYGLGIIEPKDERVLERLLKNARETIFQELGNFSCKITKKDQAIASRAYDFIKEYGLGIKVFDSTFQELYKELGKLVETPEDLIKLVKKLKVEIKPIGEDLSQDKKTQISKEAKKNWQALYPDIAPFILNALELKLNNQCSNPKDNLTNHLWFNTEYDGALVVVCGFRKDTGEELHGTSLNVVEPLKNKKMASVVVTAIVNALMREFKSLTVQSSLKNPANSLYNRQGFLIKGIIPDSFETGHPFFEMVRDDRILQKSQLWKIKSKKELMKRLKEIHETRGDKDVETAIKEKESAIVIKLDQEADYGAIKKACLPFLRHINDSDEIYENSESPYIGTIYLKGEKGEVYIAFEKIG
ncbi:MAG: hypothetical protein GF347_01465 [Candidatus Moranbacteria bacterium]|nr:hypothetical protein [Candidatus Moranbacteria bacterium]